MFRIKLLFRLLTYMSEKSSYMYFRIALSLIFLVFSIGLSIITPIAFKYAVKTFSVHHQVFTISLTMILLSYGSIWILSKMSMHVKDILLFKVLERGLKVLSLRIFKHLHNLSLSFHISKKTGHLTNAVERAQRSVPGILWGCFFYAIPTFIEIFVSIIILWSFCGFKYALVLSLTILIYATFTFFASKYAVNLQRKTNKRELETGGYIVDSLLNFETIKYFNKEDNETNRCNQILEKREKATVKSLTGMEYLVLFQNLIVGLSIMLLTFMAGRDIFLSKLDISDFVLVNGYILQFANPLTFLGYIFKEVRTGLTDVENIMEVLENTPEIVDAPNATNLDPKGDILFENVHFGYNDEEKILKGISFQIPFGKTLAIVGPSGSGKTTIGRLLLRLYELQNGDILINGQNINSVKQNSLRFAIGVIPQDVILFNESIFYNISYGFPKASEKEVLEAIKKAHLDKLIKQLTDGWNTVVGERGLKLSGGEKQRIAIARAILKKPSIYLFDEASSSLDTTTEKKIQKNIEEISKDVTTLIIAHRLSTVVNADKIIVLDDGKVAEMGSHDELKNLNGLYTKLWNAQKSAHKKD